MNYDTADNCTFCPLYGQGYSYLIIDNYIGIRSFTFEQYEFY